MLLLTVFLGSEGFKDFDTCMPSWLLVQHSNHDSPLWCIFYNNNIILKVIINYCDIVHRPIYIII